MMSVTEDLRPQTQTQPANAELRHAKMLIDGEWVGSASGETLTVENPAKRTPIATIPRGDAADVSGAVEAAERAFPAWSKVAPRDRGRLLLRIADKMEEEAEDMARLIALETGNALRTQARGEARLAADIFRYFGGLASELKGETIPLGEHVLSYTRREPLGGRRDHPVECAGIAGRS
jgi:betaine-aldehyde dehydrogenase